MPTPTSPKRGPAPSSWLDHIPTLSDDPTHPAQVALRTYALALSLSLGPSLVPLVSALFAQRSKSKATSAKTLNRIFRRELGHDGFAFAITLAVAGGAAFRKYFWPLLASPLLQLGPVVTDDDNDNGGPEKKIRKNSVGGRAGSPESESYTARAYLAMKRAIETLRQVLVALSPAQKTFISNALSAALGIVLIQSGRERTARIKAWRRQGRGSSSSGGGGVAQGGSTVLDLTSPTLDLTLLVLVRAVDSVVQAFILQRHVPPRVIVPSAPGSGAEPTLVHDKLAEEKIRRENKVRQMWTSQVDAFVFWACSARIMWCFFYEPQRLPRSYVKWINTLANLDGRIVTILQKIRSGAWSYITGSPEHSYLLQESARNLGLPPAWGDPSAIPAYGGAIADEAWKKVGLTSRKGLGGIPCELLHQEVGSSLGLQSSCTANAGLRTLKGFTEALAIYLPVHFLPVLLTRPQILLRPHRLLATLLGALRSATFLSSFIGIYWYAVCLTRTLVLARFLPFVSHDFWDGPFGCVMAGCLLCGSSIWIENGRRRGEMALYVLPRAIRAILPDKLMKSGHRGIRLAERLAFVLSFAALLTAATHRPDSLRGLSRWTLAFVTKGPNAGFWKRRRRDPSVPSTPSFPNTPLDAEKLINENNEEHPSYTPNPI